MSEERLMGSHNVVRLIQNESPYNQTREISPFGFYMYVQIQMDKGINLAKAVARAKAFFQRMDQPFTRMVERSPKLHTHDGDFVPFDDRYSHEALSRFMPLLPKMVHNPLESRQILEAFDQEDLMRVKYASGEAIPIKIEDQIIDFLHWLTLIPEKALPRKPSNYAFKRDTIGFARIHSQFAKQILSENKQKYLGRVYGDLYDQFGFPNNPLQPFDEALYELEARDLTPIYMDLHLGNMFETAEGWRVIDPGLVEIGDPLFDFAMFLHLTPLPKQQEDRMIRKYFNQIFHCRDNSPKYKKLRRQLDIYRMQCRIKSTIKDVVVCVEERINDPQNFSIKTPLFKSFVHNYNASRNYWAGQEIPPLKDIQVMDMIDSFIYEMYQFIYEDIRRSAKSSHSDKQHRVRQSPEPTSDNVPIPHSITSQKLGHLLPSSPFSRPIEEVELILALAKANNQTDEWKRQDKMVVSDQYEWISTSTSYLTKSIRNVEEVCRRLADQQLIKLVGKDRVQLSMNQAFKDAFAQIQREKSAYTVPERDQIHTFLEKISANHGNNADVKDTVFNTGNYLDYITLSQLETLNEWMDNWSQRLKDRRYHLLEPHSEVNEKSPISEHERKTFTEMINQVQHRRQNNEKEQMLPFEFPYRLFLARDIAQNINQIHDVFQRNHLLQQEHQELYQSFYDFWKKESLFDCHWVPQSLSLNVSEEMPKVPLCFSRAEQELILAMGNLTSENFTHPVLFQQIWKINSDLVGTFAAVDKFTEESLFDVPSHISPHVAAQYTLQVAPDSVGIVQKIYQYMKSGYEQDPQKAERINKYFAANQKYGTDKEIITAKKREVPWSTEEIEQVHVMMNEVYQYLQGKKSALPVVNHLAELIKEKPIQQQVYHESRALPFEPSYRESLLHEIHQTLLPTLKESVHPAEKPISKFRTLFKKRTPEQKLLQQIYHQTQQFLEEKEVTPISLVQHSRYSYSLPAPHNLQGTIIRKQRNDPVLELG